MASALHYSGEMQKRADIQGLRALAVVSVILYHVGLPGFGGGFVGVDVFFVISGFLIARKLLDDLQGDHLFGKMLAFWGARAKRLLPNGLLALLFAIVAALIFLPFYRSREISIDAAAAAVFYANVHFQKLAVDYFHHSDPASMALHFWSLSVEEQFYFLLPLGIAATALAPRRKLAVNLLLAAIVVASFAWAQRAIHHSQPSAFYLVQNRMWQFTLGGLVGVNFEIVARLSSRLRATGGWIGLALIMVSIVAFGGGVVIYPGLWALAPTIGAALVMADDRGPVSRALSVRPAVWVGDRSYSFYLWHWPLLALATERFGAHLAVNLLFLVPGLVLALAAYKWVENPIHRSHIATRFPLRRIGAAAACIGFVAVIGVSISMVPPPINVRYRTLAIEAARRDLGPNYENGCHLSTDETISPPCIFGDTSAPRTVVLFGDSHAAQWFTPLTAAAATTGWKVMARTKSSCPASDVSIWDAPKKVPYWQCDTWRKNVISELTATPPALVVMSGASDYFGWIRDRETGRVLDDVAATLAYEAGLARTVGRLRRAGSKVIIIRDTPRQRDDLFDCLSWQTNCASPREEALNGLDAAPDAFPPDTPIADFTDMICASNCPAIRDGEIIYHDNTHLAASYTATFAHQFATMLRGASDQRAVERGNHCHAQTQPKRRQERCAQPLWPDHRE